MRPLARTVLVLLSALGGAVGFAATNENPYHLKPGARGGNCLSCHADFQDTLKRPFVHTPVKQGLCSDCHNPHSSDHGKLLAADTGKICSQCHAGIIPEGAASVHKVVSGGECIKCHDPHAAKNKNNLLVAGNDLCFGCHKEMAAAVAGNTFKHAPVDKGCITCHDPHAGAKSPFLLKKIVPALCTDCHKPDQPAFTAQHAGYPVGKARCTSCHDPHGSRGKGMLWASVHPPLINKMCSQCHLESSSPNALQTKKPGFELCRGCHSDMLNETLAKKRLHWPVADQASCLNCHSPHAAKQKPLLLRAEKQLCGSCHADSVARQTKSLTKHPPVDEGDCTTCHSPHSSDNAFLFTSGSTTELCSGCHDWQKHSSHPIGEKVIDKRNKNLTVDCLSCHRSHGSQFKYFATYDSKAELCVQCHEEFKR